MATRYWKGSNPNISQVVTITVTGFDAGTSYRVTIGGVIVAVAGITSTAGTAAALQLALANSTANQFREIQWTIASSTVTGTAATAGTPFTAVSSVSGGAGTIGAVTTTTANSSPSDWGSSTNWDTFPTSGDSIVVENCVTPVLWNLDALSAIDIVDCYISSTMTAAMALPTINSNAYSEYRPTEVAFQTATTLRQTEAPGLAAGSRKFTVGTTACTATFQGAGNGTYGQEVSWWRGTNAGNVMNVEGASVSVCPLSSTTAAIATLKAIANAVVSCGTGLGTITAATVTDTTLSLSSTITTGTFAGASFVLCSGTMAVTTMNLYGGNVIYNTNGTIATLTLGSQTSAGSIDFSGDVRTLTITNQVSAYANSVYNDPYARTTMSAGIKVPKGSLADITFNFGIDRTYTIS